MYIRLDDLRGPEIAALLQAHLDQMATASPPESRHALDLDGHGEIKSMHTARRARGQGVGAAILLTILEEARIRAYERLSLETGSMAAFQPAHRLYERYGFQPCPPFGDYREDPNSLFMTLLLR
jgi:putative acetyltransferase